MRKTLIGLMVGAGASAILALPFIVRHLWHSFVFSSHQAPSISWPDWLAGAMAACLSLGLLAGCLRDAARAERMSGRARMIMALGLGGLFGLLTARARCWPEPGDRSLLYLAAGVLAGAVLLKATANRRPKAERRGLLRRRQFSMRGLLAAVLFISAGLALLISGPIQSWRLSTELALRGVRIDYDDSTWDFWRFFLGEYARPFSDDIESADLPSSASDRELALLAARGGAKMLTLHGSRITDGGLAKVRSMDRLTALFSFGAPITDAGLRNLHGLDRLLCLNLNQSAVTSAGVIELVKTLPNLELIGLSGCKIDDSVLASLSSHDRLEFINVSLTNVSDAGLAHLSGLTSLRHLNLLGTATSDQGVAHLQDLIELRRLNLSNTGITDDGLERLSGLKQLELLRLDGTKITGAGLRVLRDLPELSELSLNKTAVNDGAMVEIGRCSSLTSLELASTSITDAGFASLAGLTNLEYLMLDGTAITDAGLKSLEGMTKLRILYVRRTGVTKRGIQRLKTTVEAAEPRIASTPGLLLEVIP